MGERIKHSIVKICDTKKSLTLKHINFKQKRKIFVLRTMLRFSCVGYPSTKEKKRAFAFKPIFQKFFVIWEWLEEDWDKGLNEREHNLIKILLKTSFFIKFKRSKWVERN